MRHVSRLAIFLYLLPACSFLAVAQSWQAPTLYPAGEDAPARIVTADLLGTQSSDVLAVTTAHHLLLYANDGTGHLRSTPQTQRDNVTAVAAAKFSGSTMDDLVVISSPTPTAPLQLMLLPSQGGRTFGTAVAIAPQLALGATCQLNAADFNGDGVPDVLIFCAGSNSLVVGINNGKDSFTFTSVPGFLESGRQIQNVSAGDLDGDGLADIVVQSSPTYSPTDSRIDVLWNSAAGAFSPQLNYVSEPDAAALYVAKVDGHSSADLVSSSSNSVSVFADQANRNSLTESAALQIPSGCNVAAMASGRIIDVKYSLGQDVVAAATCNGQNQLLVFPNTAQTSLTLTPILSDSGGVPALSMSVSVASASGTVIPTGSATVNIGSTPLQEPLVSGTAQINPQPSPGTNMLQVSYSGDSNNAGASETVSIVLADGPAVGDSTSSFLIHGPSISAASNLVVDKPYTVTAEVQQTSSGAPNVLTAPSGTVTFSDNGTTIAAAQGVPSESLSSWSNSDCSFNGSQWVGAQCAADGSGSYQIAYEQDQANFSLALVFSAPGSHSIVSSFLPLTTGDTMTPASQEAVVTVLGAIAPTQTSMLSANSLVHSSFVLRPMYVGSTPPNVTISSSLNPSKFGQPVTFTPTFPPSANGQMNIYDGSTLIGTVGALYQETAVAVNSATNTIYVTSDNTAVGAPITGSVSVINGSTNGIVATIPVGSHPTSLAVDATTNMVYVDNYADKTVDIINGATNTLAQTCGTYSGVPESIAVNATTNLFYVLLDVTNANEVEVANAANCVSSAYISLPSTISTASGLAVNSSTNRLYVVADDTSSNSWLYVYNTTSNALVTRIALAPNAGSVVVNPTTNYVYVSGYSSLQAINGATNTVFATASLSSITQGLTVNPTTNTVYVANEDGYITAFAGSNISQIATISTTGAYPIYVDVNTATNTIYAPGYNTEVFVASGASNSVTDIIQSGESITTSSLAVGTHSITAQYLGDTLYSAGTSPVLYQVVNPVTATPTITISAPTYTYGNWQTFTVTVSGANGTPTGSITSLCMDGSCWFSGPLTNGSYSVTDGWWWAAGSHTFVATYSGDANYSGGTASQTFTINKNSPSVSVSCSGNPITYGSASTYTAVLGSYSATGTVTFNGLPGNPSASVSSNQTSVTTSSSIGAGSYGITASYPGDSNNNAASGTTTLTVSKTTPSISVSCSPNPITYGSQTTNCTSSVSGGTTGTESWTINGSGWTTTGLNGSAGGFAGYAAGNYTISVTYSGDGNNNPVSSSTTLTINKATPSISQSCTNPTYPNPTSCTVQITMVAGGAVPTGSVAYLDNGSYWGTVGLNGSGVAVGVGAAFAGAQTETAEYSGDGNYNAVSTSTAWTEQKATPSISASCSPNPVAYLSYYSCTANVSGSATGTVTWPAIFGGATTSLSGGATSTPTYQAMATPEAYSGTVTYNGNGNYNPVSTSVSITSIALSQSITFTPPPSPVTYGVSPIALSATATSGLPVSFSFLSGPGTASGNTLTITGPGTVVVAANQAGDAYYLPAAQVTQSIVVSQTPTVTTLSSSLDPSTYGQNVTFSTLVNTGGTTPTGTFTFENGSASIGSGSVSTVSATNLIPASTWGLSGGNWSVWDYPSTTHTVANVSAPDGSNTALAVTVAGSDHTVVQQFPAPYLSPYSSVYNHTYTFSIWARTTNGCSSFGLGMENNTNWEGGSRTVPAGSAWQRFSVTYTFTQPSDSNEVDSYVTVPTGCDVQLWGWQFEEASQPGPYVATNGATASGYGGLATLTTSSLPPGSDSITAVYGGDTNDAASTSAPLTQTVTDATPTLTVATSGSSSISGASVTFTATISSGPTSTITFYDGGTSIGTGTISGSTATLTTSSLAVGTHSITAGWAGNADYSAVTSSAISQVVNPASQTISFAPLASPVTYGVAPIALSATATSGLPVSFSVLSGPGTVSGSTLTVTGAGTVVVAANQAGNADYSAATQVTQSVVVNKATPTITWATPAAITYGTALSGTQLNATSGGVAGTFAYSPAAGTVLGAGTQTLSVTFTPTDSTDYNSVSGSVSLTVNKATGVFTITSSANPSVYGAAVSITVSGPAAATGAITLLDGANPVGTGTLSNGIATINVPLFLAGSHSLTASYPGDTNFLPSTSATYTQVVNTAAVVISIASTVNPSSYGATVTFTFTFTGVAGGAVPIGLAQITEGVSNLGTLTLNSSGVATFTTSTLVAGTHSITAAYQGDSNYH